MLLHQCHDNHSIPIFEPNDTEHFLKQYHLHKYPVVPKEVTFGLTIFYIVAYCFIYLVVYIQLWMILIYHHKRYSFQTAFLYLCIFWSGLRATLFCFFVKGTIAGMDIPLMIYWFLYCFPVCLQFCILCLLNLYFAQVACKVMPKYAANPKKYTVPLRIACSIAVLIFVAINIACATVAYDKNTDEKTVLVPLVRNMIVARVLVNDILFVVVAVSLACCLFKIAKSNSANILLRAKGTTVFRAMSIGVTIILLYVSRSLYNLAAISPLRCSKITIYDLDWYNVSDQAELANLSEDSSYIVYGLVIFVWELLPTSLTVLFFKVRRTNILRTTTESIWNLNHKATPVYFCDNPLVEDDETARMKNNSFLSDHS